MVAAWRGREKGRTGLSLPDDDKWVAWKPKGTSDGGWLNARQQKGCNWFPQPLLFSVQEKFWARIRRVFPSFSRTFAWGNSCVREDTVYKAAAAEWARNSGPFITRNPNVRHSSSLNKISEFHLFWLIKKVSGQFRGQFSIIDEIRSGVLHSFDIRIADIVGGDLSEERG